VCRLMDYVRLILSMYMFVRVERPRGSKHFVIAYVKCDWVFSFAKRFEQMRIRLNSVPPTLLRKVESEENKELRLAIIGKTDYETDTDYERALAMYSHTRVGYYRKTPLSKAIFAKDEESVEALLDGGDDPNEVNRGERNTLHVAAEEGCSLPLFRRILSMIHNVNAVTTRCRETALIIAVQNNRLDMVVSLMNHPEIDLNVQTVWGRYKRVHWTALHYAAAYGKPTIVAQLLSDDRVDTSLKDESWNSTPLGYAIDYERDECAKILREHGAPEE